MNEQPATDHDPFGGGGIARVVPTTEPQREVLAAAALGDRANTAYNEAVTVRLRGGLDAAAVEAALRTLVDRHDALRTTFTPQLDALCVDAHNRFRLEVVDLRTMPAAERERAVQTSRRQLVDTPLPLRQGPLFGARWLHLSDDTAELQLVAHHAVCDGWSWQVLLKELAALCEPAAAPLPPAPSFADYANRAASARQHTDDRHWVQRFATVPHPLDLPTDGPRPARRTFAAERVERRFATKTSQGMSTLAGQLQASPVNVLLAAMAVLLHRLTESEDLVLGLPVARQALEGLMGLVGHCVQLLPIRLSVDPTLRFDTLVARAREGVFEATEHADFTFGSLVRELGLGGDASRVPLLPVLVNIDQRAPALRFGAATAEIATVPRTAESFEIFFNVIPDGAAYVVEATFNADLFAAATMDAWLGALENLLAAAIAAPASPVGALSMVDPTRAAPGLETPPSPLPAETWLQAFAERVRAGPDRVAVLDARGPMTYAELDQRAMALAAELQRQGVRRGDVVGLCHSRSRDLVAAILGIHRLGAAYLPLDPTFPPARLQFMLADARAAVVVTDHSAPDDLASNSTHIVSAWPDRPDGHVELPTASGDDLAYLIYTSGSTGTPKGVRVHHRSLSNLLGSVALRPGFGAGDTLLAITTISFDISLLELLLPLTVGGRLALAEQAEAENPRALANALRRHRATVMQATPATWRLLVDDGWAGADDLIAFCGGERLPPELARLLLPRVRALWNLYGPTETTIWSTAAPVVDPATAAWIGRPLHNTGVWILDRMGGALPPGIPGEIAIGGLGVAAGYHERPQLTAERFVEHPRLGRLYRTGDRGRIRSSGDLECLGRMDQQVKVRGFRLELGEIEAALLALPGIGEAAVVVQGAGAADARLIAFVKRNSGAAMVDARDRLRTTLPAYMVPHRIVELAALPRLPNGKLDRRALPIIEATNSPQEFVAPATANEQVVATGMAALLKLDRLGSNDDFFANGGHSLLAAQLVAKLNQQLSADLTMRDVFDAPTPHQLARRLDGGPDAGTVKQMVVPRRQDQRSAPATPVQERMWHLEQMALGRSGYNLPSAHRLHGALDLKAFLHALQEIVRRQSVLRTTFERRDGAVWQVVHENLRLELPLTELSHLPAGPREAELTRLLDELARAPFDLAKLPLVRAHLFRLAPDQHVFFFMPHHIVWDGWSFDLLYQEMDDLYGALLAGRASSLPELAISYGDIAAWQRERSTSAALVRQVEACRERLRRFGPVRPLPIDHRRQPGMSGTGACEWLDLDHQRTQALHELGRARGATLFATTLAIYSAVLHEYSQRSKLLLATPVRGRESVEQEPVMGCCNSLVPLPIEVLPTDSFEDLVARVRATLVAGLATSEVTLEQVGSGGRSSGTVLYQALFSFQDTRRRRTHWGNLRHEMIPLFQRGATEDLGLWFVEGQHGLSGLLTYNEGVIAGTTAKRLRERFLAIADAVLADPRGPLANALLTAPPQPAEDPAADAPQPTPEARDKLTPRNDHELILTRIWSEILGVRTISVDDDFFDLGGNSLTAIRCVNEFERATGILLDLGEVFRSPTIARLVASLTDKGVTKGPLLIPLQREGCQPPLFCLLGVWIYRHLATALGSDQPVYGVFVPEETTLLQGVRGATPTSVSVDGVASAYVKAILAARPAGPYRLAGLSFGGVVAMEVARRLRQSGATIEGVVLIDTILPTSYRRKWLPRAHHMLKKAWALGVRQTAREALRRLGLTKSSPTATATTSPPHDTAFRHIAADLDREVRKWLVTFPAPQWPTLLLRAKDNAWGHQYSVAGDYGWGTVVGAGLKVADLTGDHLGILLTPNLDDLAQAIQGFFTA